MQHPGAPAPPGGGIPNPPPPPQAPPAVPIAGTFEERYSTLPDALGGNYTAFMAAFAANGNDTPAQLRDRLLGASDAVPKVMLCMPTNDPPIVRVIHTPFKFSPTLGNPSQWDNQNFAYVSDIGPGNQVSIVNWPNDTFRLSPNVRVPTAATMEDQWNTAAGADCVGPFTAADANTEDKQTRNVMVVPPAYVPLVMANPTMTPQQMWNMLYAQIVADNNEVACAPLLTWLQVASTYRPQAAGALNPEPPAVHGLPLVPPIADAILQERTWEKTTSILPSLRERTGTAAMAYTTTLMALQQEFAAQRRDQAARAAAASAPKTVGDKYPQLVPLLCRVCEVATEAQLPALWSVVANSSKKEAVTAMQSWMDSRAVQPGATGVSPIISPEIYEVIASGKIASQDLDDLTSGLSIFLVQRLFGSSATETRARASAYQLLYGGGGAPSLQDVAALTASSPCIPPTTMAYLMQNKGYATLLDGVLGVDHRVSVLFRDNFLPNLQQVVLAVDDQFGVKVPSFLPLMLRHTQLEVGIYLQNALEQGTAADEPNFNELCNLIRRRQWPLLPTMPPRYLAADDSIPTAASDTNDGGGGGKRKSGENGGEVVNPRKVHRLADRFDQYEKPLRTLTTNNANNLPKTNGGEDLCLSFHLRGNCFKNCRRCSTHRDLIQSEEDAIDTFMDKCNVPKL